MIDYGAVAPAVDVLAALESVERVEPLGERTIGAGAGVDPAST